MLLHLMELEVLITTGTKLYGKIIPLLQPIPLVPLMMTSPMILRLEHR
ncbi:hypothetical protein NC653_031893 [Populus alba x Populus x berolinensis]|uniref:Uncharacterized protein n=1 Tax=Populus alba x Populus x berolinensis TaxID=444605 RepID=A0AAD6LZM9_9ROSI|nr:hypothetical protein NC653_031893 [Populus alba x Populus x berolinensis]